MQPDNKAGPSVSNYIYNCHFAIYEDSPWGFAELVGYQHHFEKAERAEFTRCLNYRQEEDVVKLFVLKKRKD